MRRGWRDREPFAAAPVVGLSVAAGVLGELESQLGLHNLFLLLRLAFRN